MRTQGTQGSEKLFRVDSGVLKGRVLLPLLFIMYMDKCIKNINMCEDEATVLAYADDVAVIVKSAERLQR